MNEMMEFLKNIKRPFLIALPGAIILILILLVSPGSNTASGDPLDIALICDDATCTTTTDHNGDGQLEQPDAPLLNHLRNTLGHNVTTIDDGGQSCPSSNEFNLTPFDVVVISDSADSCNMAWLKDKVIGILSLDAHNNNEFCLSSGSDDDNPSLGVVTVTDNDHYITQFVPDPVDVDLAIGQGQPVSGGFMTGWGNGVQSLGYHQGQPTKSVILTVEQGGTLVSFSDGQGTCQSAGSAAHRRVIFGARLFGNLTNPEGITMFNRALEWVAGSPAVGGALSGSLESSTFDTGVTGGAAYNSIMWLGELGTGIVKFQIASANCSGGQTNPPTCSGAGWGGTKTNGDGAFTGTDGTSATYYQPSGPGVPAVISTLYHNNKKYFRYRVFLEKDEAATTPVVQDIIINWSP